MGFPSPLHFCLFGELLCSRAVGEVAVVLESAKRDLRLNFLQDTFQLFAIRRRTIESRLLPAPFTLIPEIEKQFARLDRKSVV